MSQNIGVINEQGYPAGQFGYEELNEQDKENLKLVNEKPDTPKKPRIGDVFED